MLDYATTDIVLVLRSIGCARVVVVASRSDCAGDVKRSTHPQERTLTLPVAHVALFVSAVQLLSCTGIFSARSRLHVIP